MLEMKAERNLLKSKEAAVLEEKQLNSLITKMAMYYKRHTVEDLRGIIALKKSVFEQADFIETFKGETIRIANFNVYQKTIQFAKEFFAQKAQTFIRNKKSKKEGKRENKTILEISVKGISILKIKFSIDQPIEFSFLKNEFSYDELYETYEKKMNSEREHGKIKDAQEKFKRIIKFGPDAIEEVKDVYQEYIKEFSIDESAKYSWYTIKYHNLKQI